jgi:26S proteasome regulatory subunit N10
MPLESAILSMDTSEHMRNSDYIPNRLEAMRDAVNFLANIKMQQNRESAVGLVSSGGSPKVLTSCTQDMAALLTATANCRIGGQLDFVRACMVASLALKHRRNKNSAQRIVFFVGSPVTESESALQKLAKQLKKNNIAVDVVSMGESDANEALLRGFVDAVDKNGNSHLVTIPPGLLPSDVLISSPVVTEEGGDATGPAGAAGGAGGGGGMANAFAEYGGVDPSLDPELAMALRASMEEERARMGAPPPATNAVGEAPLLQEVVAPPAGDDEALLQEALRMSMGGGEAAAAADDQIEEVAADEDDDDEQEALRLALAMSTEQPPTAAAAAVPPASSTTNSAFMDPAFVQQLLDGLPGVDLNDPSIQEMLASLAQPSSPPTGGGAPNPKKQKEGDDEKKKEG